MSAVTLRALVGEPLAEAAIEAMVTATARAIAERQGVELIALETTLDSITVELAGDRMIAIGFAAELRRVTTAWYTRKYGTLTLWGEPE